MAVIDRLLLLGTRISSWKETPGWVQRFFGALVIGFAGGLRSGDKASFTDELNKIISSFRALE